MKKIFLSGAMLSLLVASLTSCSVSYPSAASNSPIGTKRGESKTVRFLAIDFNGQYGIKEAATNGKITGAVSTVDEKYSNYVLFKTKTLTVTGE